MFGVVPRQHWAQVFPPNEANRIALSLNCYVIETGEHTVVIDTGGGARVANDAPLSGGLIAPHPLPELMAQDGIDPLKADVVINSHLHWDHCGGNNLSQNGRTTPSFPNAKYYCSRGEWEHAHEMNPRDAVSYDPRNFDSLVRSGQMELVREVHEPLPGIRMQTAAGHTRDLQLVTAESNGNTFCFLSDLVPTRAHLLPGWSPAFDLYPLDLVRNKTTWLSKAAAGHWTCGFAHDPTVAFAAVNKRFGLLEEQTFGGRDVAPEEDAALQPAQR